MPDAESEPFLNSSAELGVLFEQRRCGGILSLLKPYQVGINMLALIFVPLGFVATLLGWHDVVVSALNFLAIIPLSGIISDASDTMSNRWGSLVGGLINATFGNTVELIVGILAIVHNELGVAQSIMLGSILSDILMVQGFCIIIAARGSGVISVSPAIVDALSSLMLMAAMALVLPTALYSTFPDTAGSVDVSKRILSFSRATVGVLLVIYAIYLYFQMKTHSSLFMDEKDDTHHDEAYGNVPATPIGEAVEQEGGEGEGEGEGEDDVPSLREVSVAAALLVISGLLIANCTHAFMGSLDGMTKALGISKTFVALIVIPMASNAPEMTQVVAASRKKKIHFAIGVIIGSILQISLFVLPGLVLVGWLMDRAMDLYFETSQTYTLLFAVILVNQVLQDGQYTYLHGIMLLSVYFIIAAAFFVDVAN